MEKENKMLKGGVTYEKESPERKVYIANLMYRYPEETETIELIPTETIVYNNSFGRTNGIVEQGRLRDIREEQEIRAREARLQRRNTSEKPARQRIDYINKVGNVKDFGVPQVNENVIMKAKKQVKPEKNYEEIANLFYPSMTEESQIQVKKKEPVLLGETSILKEPDMITLADKEYVVKPLDGTFTGAAASVITNREENVPIKYTNIDMLLPYLSGKESIMKHIETPPYKPYNDINLIKSLLLNYKNIANWGKYNSTFSDDLKEKLKSFIKEIEGTGNFKAYKKKGDVPTIGYGHTKSVKLGSKITEEEAEQLLEQDIINHINVLSCIKVPLTDNQKIALASLIFNIGGTKFRKTNLLKYINEGQVDKAAMEFDKFIYSGGEVKPGLIKRREKEKELFLSSLK